MISLALSSPVVTVGFVDSEIVASERIFELQITRSPINITKPITLAVRGGM